MDTSIIYINMCQKATEIQQNWNPDVMDCFWNIKDATDYDYNFDNTKDAIGHVFTWLPCGDATPIKVDGMLDWGRHLFFDIEYNAWINPEYRQYWVNDFKLRNVFLPRQDQLQQIYAEWCDNGELIKSSNWFIVILDDFQDWVLNSDDNINQFDSLEQLWLAFVMKKIFNKIWNGDNWVR